MHKTSAGKIYPLGSQCVDDGVNFALYSENATKVELCLFNNDGSVELERYELTEKENNIWHIFVHGITAGQVYGYRVYGEYNPQKGKRFNHNKLLFDPYGKKLVGKLIWDKAIFGYDVDSPMKDLSFSELDSAPYVPKSVVIENKFDWQGDDLLHIPAKDTIIYEAHIKGISKLAPQVESMHRGKFLGITGKSAINYLKWLGVTSVELLPIHAFFADTHFNEDNKNLKNNYWGYASYSFFAPEPSYLSCDNIDEVKQMVKLLHKENVEVLLDVVFNHTGEGNQLGPTLCYRGIDNEVYYTLDRHNPRYYYDSTGCGNTMNLQNPAVMTLVMDSLRYWVKEIHIDGFRFDLAPSLSRYNEYFIQNSGFLLSIRQDECLRNVKLIAEPWDVAPGGYQLGAFPPGWYEWNDQYRNVIRKFWKGDTGMSGLFASRISGSSDIFNYSGRHIWSSVNFITSHDGFSLYDLVSYNEKHNLANGENNRDGSDVNHSWNSGVEGVTDNPEVLKLRIKRAKAMIATLLLSFGTPMIRAGDEILHSTYGNNNPYCQDNILSWIAWEGLQKFQKDFARFVSKLIHFRKQVKIFNRTTFLEGKIDEILKTKDIVWYKENGEEFSNTEWHDSARKVGAYCGFSKTCAILCIFNSNDIDINWKLPNLKDYKIWELVFDTAEQLNKKTDIGAEKMINVPAWSVVIIKIKK